MLLHAIMPMQLPTQHSFVIARDEAVIASKQ